MPIARVRWIALGLGFALASAAAAADPVDALGDPLPKGAKARLGTARGVFVGHRDMTALPPDYKLFAAVDAQSQKGAVIWDLESGRVLNRLAPEKPGATDLVAVSGDGKRLVTWGSGVVTVWEIATGRVVLTFRPGRDGPDTGRYHHSLFSLSGDGKLLAMGGWPAPPGKGVGKEDQEPEVAATVWDVEKNERVVRVVVRQNALLVPVLSRDGKTLATWGIQHTWTPVPEGQPKLAPPPRPSPDPGRLLRLWDVATGKEVSRVRMSRELPSSVEFSPDGLTIAAAAAEHWTVVTGIPDGLIERWDTRTGEPKVPLRVSDGRWLRVAFSPDSKTLAAVAVDGAVRRWANADGRLLGQTVIPVATSPELGFVDGERLVVWRANSAYAVAWEVPSGKLLSPRREHGIIYGVGFAAGGKEVITAGYGKRLVRWDAATGKPVGSVSLQAKLPQYAPLGFGFPGVVISPNATRAFFRGLPVVYDLTTGAELFSLPSAPKDADGVDYLTSADLSRLVVLSLPRGPKAKTAACDVWDVNTRKKLKEFTLPAVTEFEDRLISARGVTGESYAALSPDGTHLLTLGTAKAPPRMPGQPPSQPALLIAAWDLTTGKRLSVTEVPNELNLNRTIAVSNDSGAVYRGHNGPLRAVDYERGQLGFEIDTPRQQSVNLPPVFSPDGTKFAVAVAPPPTEKDGTFGVRVYDWPRGKVLHTFTGHTAPVSCLAFSPDGKTLASGSHDTTVLLWDLSVMGK